MKKAKKILALFLGLAMAATSATSAFAIETENTQGVDVKQENVLVGDADRDGAVTSSDALVVLRMSISEGRYEGVPPYYIDVDHDGSVTANDALLILRESVYGNILSQEDDNVNTPDPAPHYDSDTDVVDTDKPQTTDTDDTDTEPIDIPIERDTGIDGGSDGLDEKYYDLNPKFETSDTDFEDEKNPDPIPENTYQAMRNFAPMLLKATYKKGENFMISPVSLYAALAMLENGTNGDTRDEILSLLQCGGSFDEEALNDFFHDYMECHNEKDVMQIANTIYVTNREDVTINPDYAKTMEDKYFAEVFTATPDNATVKRLNKWASDHTDGQIKKILEDNALGKDTNSLLINAINFDGKWEDPYEDYQIQNRPFRNVEGYNVETDYLWDKDYDSYYYYDGKAVAFKRPYVGPYEFVGILPNKDLGVDGYIERMTGNTLSHLLNDWDCRYNANVETYIPKFEFESKIKLEDALYSMGMETAFNEYLADLHRIATSSDPNKNTFVSAVTQYTHVTLDEKGTKAAAVTVIENSDTETCAEEPLDDIIIDLRRPFIFVIYDTIYNVPVFIGTVNHFDAKFDY